MYHSPRPWPAVAAHRPARPGEALQRRAPLKHRGAGFPACLGYVAGWKACPTFPAESPTVMGLGHEWRQLGLAKLLVERLYLLVGQRIPARQQFAEHLLGLLTCRHRLGGRRHVRTL